jgi:hypothetical protein
VGLRSQWMSAEIHLSALKVLFYVGMLTIAMIIDRGHGLDLDKLIVGLQNESELITRHTDACCDPAWLLLTQCDQQRCRVPKPTLLPDRPPSTSGPLFGQT